MGFGRVRQALRKDASSTQLESCCSLPSPGAPTCDERKQMRRPVEVEALRLATVPGRRIDVAGDVATLPLLASLHHLRMSPEETV